MILGHLESKFHSCAHANLSSISPINSTTRKGPDNHRGEDATFDVLTSLKPSVVQITLCIYEMEEYEHIRYTPFVQSRQLWLPWLVSWSSNIP